MRNRIPALLVLTFALALPTRPALALFDQDLNGLSDLWELAYPKAEGAMRDPAVDDDGDGIINRDEAVAGTDPDDAASFLQIAEVTKPIKGSIYVRWATVAGKQYRLQVTFDGTAWTDVGPALIGTGGMAEGALPVGQTFLKGADFSRFTGMATNASLQTVKNNALNGVAPNLRGALAEVEVASPALDHYGQWIRGWIIPPKTGAFRFWIASDDASELWLSPDADPANKLRIALVSNWTDFRQWDKAASQQSEFQTLKKGVPYYFEVFHKEWTGGDHVSVAWTGPGLDPVREILGGAAVVLDPLTVAKRIATSGQPQFRVLVADVDSDGDSLTDAEEETAGLNPDVATTTPQVADLLTLQNALVAPHVITVGVSDGRAYEKEGKPAVFTVFRSGNVQPLTVQLAVSGTADSALDYQPIATSIFFGVGQTSASVEVSPADDLELEAAETVTLSIVPDAAYEIGNPSQASVAIDDAADLLYVAPLRSVTGAKSGGHGSAALRVRGNKEGATFSVSYGNLASPQADTQLYISSNGRAGATVQSFGPGQISSRAWDLVPLAGVTKEQLIIALAAGKVWARVTSERFPDGEIYGRLVREKAFIASQKPKSAPPAPPRARNDGEAARFLTQATFGPTEADIALVRKLGFSGWIANQFSQVPTMHRTYLQIRREELLAESMGANDGYQRPRIEAWWQGALAGPDQLRQRMAFALSEIFVVSDVGELGDAHEGLANYYDILVRHAFGNYRDLLKEVTLSPMMGRYLSMARNRKPDRSKGLEPDENYSREVMQLLSIGLNQLHPDGTIKLGPDGLPIPTYSQADIVGLAHVFTGWSFGFDPAAPPENLDSHFLYGRDDFRPMVMYPKFHDLDAKRILNGTSLPAGLTGEAEMEIAIDALFHHPNVGPFIARQLIQRFVTSNPSPGYVYRVAKVFNNNGRRVRGDLKATLRAVLLDYEARAPELLANQSHGKLREPLLRFTQVLRSFRATGPVTGDPRFFLDLSYDLAHQGPLKSPSVFNFFQPGYIHPGAIAAAGLFSPEFQITSETTIISQVNLQNRAVSSGFGTPQNVNIRLDLTPEVELLNRTDQTPEVNQAAVLDRLNVMMLGGQMTARLRQQLMEAWAELPANFGTSTDRQRERVQMALFVIMASPEYAVQK